MTTDILPAGDAAHSLSSTTAETPAAKTELVFIDTGVADYQTLVNGVRPDVEVVLIASSRDGMRQIAEALAGRSGIAALHVLSHGTEGMLALGSS